MKKQNFFKAILLATIMLVGSMSMMAAEPVEIVKWSFAEMPGGAGDFGTSPLSPVNEVDNLMVGSLTRHWTTGSGSGAGNAWGGNNLTAASFDAAVTANEFVTFFLKANENYTLSLNSIGEYNIRRSNTGPTTGQWQYAIGAGAFINIGDAITWGSGTTNAGNAQAAIDLSGITVLQNVEAQIEVRFRLVVWGASAPAGTFYFNDHANGGALGLSIFGTVAEVGAPEQVATPTFSVPTGTYFEPQNVEISTATEHANIYYTINGDEPTASSTPYTSPIEISATTTLKAIAIKDAMTNSNIATATYTFPTEVANIEEFIALEEGIVAKITGTLTVVTQQTRNIFVQDDSGWLLIDWQNPANNYVDGDQITGAIGTRFAYGGAPQFTVITTIGLPEGVAGAPAVPALVAPEDLTDADLNRYITFEEVEIADDVTYTTASATDGTIVTEDGTMIIRNHYRLISASFDAGNLVNLKGIVRTFNDAIQVYLLNIELAGNVNLNEIKAGGANIYAAVGAVIIESENAQAVEIFNITGQKIAATTIATGTNSIAVNSGIVFVKIGSQTVKVVVP